MKTIKEKIERMDLIMVSRPKGNHEAYINKVSSVIVLQDKIKKEDKNMTMDTITKSRGRIQYIEKKLQES